MPRHTTLLPLVFVAAFVAIWLGQLPSGKKTEGRAWRPALFSAGDQPLDNGLVSTVPTQVSELSLAVEVLYSRQYYGAAADMVGSIEQPSLRDDVLALSFHRIASDLGIPQDAPLRISRLQSPFNQEGQLTAMLIKFKDLASDPVLKSHLEIRLAQYFDKLGDIQNLSSDLPEGTPIGSAETMVSDDLKQNVLLRIETAVDELESIGQSNNHATWQWIAKLVWTAGIAAAVTLCSVIVTFVGGYLGGASRTAIPSTESR